MTSPLCHRSTTRITRAKRQRVIYQPFTYSTLAAPLFTKLSVSDVVSDELDLGLAWLYGLMMCERLSRLRTAAWIGKEKNTRSVSCEETLAPLTSFLPVTTPIRNSPECHLIRMLQAAPQCIYTSPAMCV